MAEQIPPVIPTDADEFVRRFAEASSCDGVQYEPRIYSARLTFSEIAIATASGRLVRADDSVFKNGESTPVQITHVLGMMDPRGGDLSPDPTIPVGDPRLIQRFGFRVQANDNYYMNRRHIPFPHLHNVQASMNAVANRSTAVWNFEKPVRLGYRDALVVNVNLVEAPASARVVSVGFAGYGASSGRPYHLADTLSISDTDGYQLDPSNLKNEGSEVIVITQMTVYCGAPISGNNPTGDVRQLQVRVRQTGTGTNQQWDKGDIDTTLGTGTATERPPLAGLWGPSGGRAVIHRLPKDGWIWQPGQGVTVDVLNFDTTRQQLTNYEEHVWVAMLGYRIII